MAKTIISKAQQEKLRLAAIKELSVEQLKKVKADDINAILKRDKVKWRINIKRFDPKNFDEFPRMVAKPEPDPKKFKIEKFIRTKYSIYYLDANGKLAKRLSTTMPTRFDWRELGDVVTAVKNQGSCGSCVAFATSAAIESQYRIQNYNNSRNILDLSEASLFFTAQRECSVGWWCSDAMEKAKEEGVCLEYNYPYIAKDQAAHMEEGSTRIVKIEDYLVTDDVKLMKRWLFEKGPLVARYDFYTDFRTFWHSCENEDDVYTKTALGVRDGGHAICIVGYDDSKKAWICKNSWGTSSAAHPSGYFYMGYGECGIDAHMYLPVNVYDKITNDYLTYNPNNLKIVKESSCWLLTDGRMRMKIFASEEDAQNGLKVARRHTRQCFVGRDNKRSNRKDFIFEYWDGNSGLPAEKLSKTDIISYNPANIYTEYNASLKYWQVCERYPNGGGHIIAIADNMADALAILYVIERKSKECFIGRDNTKSNRKDYIMTYFE